MSPYVIPGLIRQISDTGPQEVTQYICDYFKVPLEKMFQPCRKGEVVQARRVSCWIMRKFIGMSLKAIGTFFHQDHTTIMISVRGVDDERGIYKKFQKQLDEVVNVISQRAQFGTAG